MNAAPPPPQRVLDLDEKSWWDFWNRSYRSQDGVDAVSTELFQRVAKAAANASDVTTATVLEIGCGSGALSRMLQWYTYCGVDISPAAIEIAREKSRTVARPTVPQYNAADFHDWPIQSSTYNLVICVDAVAYFRDQALALRKMAEGLRPDGKLVLTTINPFVYQRIRRTATNPIQEGAISHWLRPAELRSLVQSAGFSIQRLETIMPRGDAGFLRILNSHKLNHLLGSRFAAVLNRSKESAGLGQYQLLVARKA
jgi:2-polyprenyl-3-methyl-5-hydroxy-6-metoxy-1,4-benzoquinol methylase